jgi:ribosome-associated protein
VTSPVFTDKKPESTMDGCGSAFGGSFVPTHHPRLKTIEVVNFLHHSQKNEPGTMNTDENLEKSRTQLKKEATALQKMGEKLVTLSDDQLSRMALPPALIEAIGVVRTMNSRGARRRQMQYIGSIMRSVDKEPIEKALMEIEQGAYRQAKAFHRIERMRDQLVAGEGDGIEGVLETFPDADRQRLGQLVRSARKEKERNAPPKSARNLFRYLKDLNSGG